MTEHRARLVSFDDVVSYVLGGNSIFTIVSRRTSARFTFKVRKAPPKSGVEDATRPWWVSVLARSDNSAEESYTFLGGIKADAVSEPPMFWLSPKSPIAMSAQSARVALWFFGALLHRDRAVTGLLESGALEVWHEGRCGRCGRRLTVPKSIETGLGPECASRSSAA
jgi:hypothetical protein